MEAINSFGVMAVGVSKVIVIAGIARKDSTIGSGWVTGKLVGMVISCKFNIR